LKKKKQIEKFTIVVDTREQLPYKFNIVDECNGAISKKLECGDYSILNLEHVISIERKKSVAELYNNLGKDRGRFFNELENLRRIKYKFLVLEFSYDDIKKGCIYSRISPNYIISNLLKLQLEYGINVIYAGNRVASQDIVKRILNKVWKYYIEGRINGNNCYEKK
jgi:ERCC4-type nuclease